MFPIGTVRTRYQITLHVADAPGVLSTVAGVLAKHGVSVETVEQTSALQTDAPGADRTGATATLVIGTHLARESDLADTVVALRNEDVVAEITSVLRVVGG